MTKDPIVAHVNWDIGQACAGCKDYQDGYCHIGPDNDMIYISGDEIRCSGFRPQTKG